MDERRKSERSRWRLVVGDGAQVVRMASQVGDGAQVVRMASQVGDGAKVGRMASQVGDTHARRRAAGYSPELVGEKARKLGLNYGLIL